MTGDQTEADWNGTDFGTGDPVFDLGGNQVLLSSKWDSGSGKGDYVFLIPKSAFDFTSPDQYLVVYMQMGTTSNSDPASTDGGFDEFGVLSVAEAPPSIHLEKVATPTEIFEGVPTDVTYTYTVTNTSPAGAADPLTLTSFVDDNGTADEGDDVNLLQGFVQGSDYGDFYTSGDDGDYFLESNEAWVFNYTKQDVVSDVVGSTIHNVAVVEAHDNENVSVSDDDDALVTVQNLPPAIELVKTASPTSIGEGEASDVTYTYTVTNTSEAGAADPLTLTSFVDDNGTADESDDVNLLTGFVQGSDYGDFYTSGDDGDYLLESNEAWVFNYTKNGVVANAGDTIHNVAVVEGQDDEGNSDSAEDDATVTFTDQLPEINLVKTADPTSIDEGTATDITYTYEVTNTSPAGAFDPLLLTSFVDDNGTADEGDDVNLLTGFVAGSDYGDFYTSGDDDENYLVDSDETWTFNYTRAGVLANSFDGSLINTAVVVGKDDEGNPDSAQDDAIVTVTNVLPAINIEKTVDANEDGIFHDNEEVQAFGDSVTYKYELTNTSPAGNNFDPLTIDNLTDDGGQFAGFDLVVNGVLQDGVSFSGDINTNNLLDVGETWTYTKTVDVNLNPGIHLLNTAVVTGADDEGSPVSDSDTADILAAVVGPGVRTPGFWSNLGKQFWDGIQGNETKVGPNFPIGELTYQVDSNNDGSLDNVKGLLIGDYDKDGITDPDEDTFFISLIDAHKIIDASQKDLQDGRFVLARDEIATWLNYLAGNPIGEATDENSPKTYLNEGIDWLQATSTGGSQNDTFDSWSEGGAAVKTSSPTWQVAITGNADSASEIHTQLDSYNNTGSTFDIVNGVKQFHMYASDAG
jgi:hypothetical protein